MKTIFVSSTFVDMQQERDILRDTIEPNINEIAENYGDHVDFCDLRWGINTSAMEEEAGSMKVLDVCLDEIRHSQPPMILVLGERYGWMPGREKIRTMANAMHWNPDDDDISVTALEIEYGVFVQKRPFFLYERKIEGEIPDSFVAEDALHSKKLEDLKNRLRQCPQGKVRTYRAHLQENQILKEDLNHLAAMIEEDLKEYYAEEWEAYEKLHPFQKRMDRQWEFLRNKRRQFLAREQDAEEIMDMIRSGETVTLIRGVSGSGKSTMLSYIALRMLEQGYEVLPFMGGLNRDTLAVSQIEPYIREYLSEKTDFAKGQKKLLVVIDALDQLAGSVREGLFNIQYQENLDIQYLITATPDIEFQFVKDYYLGLPKRIEREEIIDGITRARRRELSDSVKDYICRQEKITPLVISLMLDRFRMMNREDYKKIAESTLHASDAIAEYQIQILKTYPKDAAELGARIFKDAAERINETFLTECVELMAVSRYGLRMEDMEGLCAGWNRIDFAKFISYLREHFIIREDGRYDFSHKSIREGILKEMDVKAANRKIAQYLQSLSLNDPIKQSEWIYHLSMADMRTEVMEAIWNLYRKEKEIQNIVQCKNAVADSIYRFILKNGNKWWIDAFTEEDRDHVLYAAWMIVFQVAPLFAEKGYEIRLEYNLLDTVLRAVEQFGSERLGKNNYERLKEKIDYRLIRISELLGETAKAQIYYRKEIDQFLAEKKELTTDEDKREFFHRYYNWVWSRKSSIDQELLYSTLQAVGQEFFSRISTEYIRELASKDILPGWFYGCLGEIYGRRREYSSQLRAYRQDLQYRRMYYDYIHSAEAVRSLAGGYGSVADALHHTNAGKEAVLEYLQKSWNCSDEWYEKKEEISIEALQLEVDMYLKHYVMYIRYEQNITPDIGIRLFTYAARCLNYMIQCYKSIDSEDNFANLLASIQIFRAEFMRIWSMDYYFGKTETKIVMKVPDAVKRDIKTIRISERNLKEELEDSDTESERRENLTVIYQKLQEMEERYGRILDALLGVEKFTEWKNHYDSGRILETIEACKGESKILSVETCKSVQLTNAAAKIGKGIKEASILALLDQSRLGNGKKGVIFTVNALYASSLQGPVLYRDIGYIEHEKKEIMMTIQKDRQNKIVSIAGDKGLYEVLRGIQELMKKEG